MQYSELIRRVERVAPSGVDQKGVERALGATLTTLAECLPADVAGDLAAQLPRQAQAYLTRSPGPAQELSLEAFLHRVAAREERSPSEALHHVRAVLDAVAHAATGHELEHVRAHLPGELQVLFAPPAAAGWPDTRSHRPHA